MINILKSGITGMLGQNIKVENIANNISNINTTGYKSSRVNFSDLLYAEKIPKGTPVVLEPVTGLLPQVGTGSRIADIYVNQAAGILHDTGRMLDLAVEGEGYFRVELPDGSSAYTRDGALSFNSEGRLVTAQGNSVSMEGFQPLPPGSRLETLNINSLGEVKIEAAVEDAETERMDVSLGRLRLYSFENPSGLTSLGNNLFAPNESSGNAVWGYPGEEGLGSVRQGILEGSNVNLVEEMSRLLISQRYFQLNSRSVRYADEMWSLANNIRR